MSNITMAKNTQSKEITFWNLLKDNKIEIPIIQRDYAQGRIGKEYLRKTFLESLKSALDDTDNEEKLKLDFVYGTSENGKIYPLDGQQRLTTLWLLHWYIALRSGNLNESNCSILNKFTYETRISSREFCKQLCNHENWVNYQWSGNISEYIKDQSWFSSTWLQDPTISSMLNMLAGTKPIDGEKEDIIDGIEEVLICPKNCELANNNCAAVSMFQIYWKSLTSNECSIIFYYLPITDMGLTDDLYIKMNARGKQLSSFENLKADLIGYVQRQAAIDERWNKFLDAREENKDVYLPYLLDTKWTDLFWKNKSNSESKKPCKIDEIFFAFINRFFWNEVVLNKISNQSTKKLDDDKNYKYFNNSEDRDNSDTTIVYHGLSIYKYHKESKHGEYEIPYALFEKLVRVLGNYIQLQGKLGKEELSNILYCPFDKDKGHKFFFIPEYLQEDDKKNKVRFDNDRNEILPITHLTQVERIVFSAVCKFFNECDYIINTSKCKTTLKQWMRVVWNLVSGLDEKGGAQIRTVDAMLKGIKVINNLNSQEVNRSLRSLNNIDDIKYKDDKNWGWNKKLFGDNFNARTLEECIKSEKILRDNKNNFSEIEEKFRGSIRFLFTDENSQIDWNNYSTKMTSALEIRNDYNEALQKLIKCCNSTEQLKHIIYEGSELVMITNLLNRNLVIPVHRLLMEQIPTVQSSLQEHILDNIKQNILGNIKQLNGHKLKIDKKDNQYYLAVPKKSKNDERIDLGVYDVIENTKA